MSTVTAATNGHRDQLREERRPPPGAPSRCPRCRGRATTSSRQQRRWRTRTGARRGSRAGRRRARARTGGSRGGPSGAWPAMGPTRSAPITGAVTRNHVITASGRTPRPRIDTASSRWTSDARREQRPRERERAAQQLAGGEVVARRTRPTRAGRWRRPRRRGPASNRPGARSADARGAQRRRRTRTTCCSRRAPRPRSKPSTPRLRNAASSLDRDDEDGGEPDDRGRGLLEDGEAAVEEVRHRHRRQRRQAVARRRRLARRSPPRRARRRARRRRRRASGAAQSTAPFYRPGPAAESGGVPSRHTGSRGGLRRVAPTATASPTCTTTGTATSPTSTACTDAARRAGASGGPVLELGVGSGGWPCPLAARGVEVHGIDASRRDARRGCGPSPAATRIHLTAGDMADLALVDPPRVRGGVRRLQHASSTSARPRRSSGASSGSPTLLAPDGLFVLEAFVPAEPTTHGHRRVGDAAAHHRRRGGAVGEPARRARPDDHGPAHPRHRGGHPAAPVAPPLRRVRPSSTPWRRPPASRSRGGTRTGTETPFGPDASVHVSAYRRGNVRTVLPPGSA